MEFSTVPLSILNTFTMMVGDLNTLNLFVKPLYHQTSDRSAYHPFLSLTILIIFIILMPILLINLLTGLAVGNIESIQQNAQIKRLSMQVALYTNLYRFLPTYVLNRTNKNQTFEYPLQDISHINLFSVFRTPVFNQCIYYTPLMLFYIFPIYYNQWRI